MELGLPTALHDNRGNAGKAVEPGFDGIGRQFPKPRLRNVRRRQAVADDGERGKGQPVRDKVGVRRERWTDARQRRIDQVQSLVYVDAPVEEQVDFSGSATGYGPDRLKSRYRVQSFF